MRGLPEPFQDLERFMEWVLPTERERHARRYAATMDEIREFYDAMKPRMDEVITYLNKFPLDDLPEDANRLFLMGLSLMEISNAVELFGRQRAVEGYDVDQMVAVE